MFLFIDLSEWLGCGSLVEYLSTMNKSLGLTFSKIGYVGRVLKDKQAEQLMRLLVLIGIYSLNLLGDEKKEIFSKRIYRRLNGFTDLFIYLVNKIFLCRLTWHGTLCVVNSGLTSYLRLESAGMTGTHFLPVQILKAFFNESPQCVTHTILSSVSNHHV